MPRCINGVCLDNLCYCNDGFGGKGCEMPGKCSYLIKFIKKVLFYFPYKYYILIHEINYLFLFSQTKTNANTDLATFLHIVRIRWEVSIVHVSQDTKEMDSNVTVSFAYICITFAFLVVTQANSFKN